ncbi:Transposable element Hobo transposase [Frankliniella fusca]|uniref:Transposable element Hobo transposase n=1 Tax=Frankliniella fusca TaxID=407009 RepID=A0AAE1LRE1_9NEOP|nr:Transposable element Hobo transposase [Frankliniella fusca]
MWTEDFGKTNIIDIYAYYSKFESLGISEEQFGKIDWVTDRGANVKKSPRGSPAKAIKGSNKVLLICQNAEAAASAVKSADKKIKLPFDLQAFQKLVKTANTQHYLYSATLQFINSHRKKSLYSISVLTRLVEQILKAVGQPPLMCNHEEMQEAIDFLSVLEHTGTVPASEYEKLRLHFLPGGADEADFVQDTKTALSSEVHVLARLHQVKLAKDLVTYMKSSNRAQLLDRRLLQEVDTRWNSMCIMLKSVSVVEKYTKITEVLTAKKEKKRLKGLDLEVLKWMVDLLDPFRELTLELEGQLYPTMPLVLPTSVELFNHCSPQLLDNPTDEAMRQRALEKLTDKLKPTMKEKVATFLVPAYRNLEMLSEDERTEVHNHVRSLIRRPDPSPTADLDDPETETPDEPLAKKPRFGSRFQKWKAPAVCQRDEVADYIEKAPCVDLEDVYTYWKSQVHYI